MIFVDLTNPSYQVWILAAIQQGMCRYHQPVILEVATCHSTTGHFCFCLILVTINELIIMPDISRSHQPVISGVSACHNARGYAQISSTRHSRCVYLTQHNRVCSNKTQIRRSIMLFLYTECVSYNDIFNDSSRVLAFILDFQVLLIFLVFCVVLWLLFVFFFIFVLCLVYPILPVSLDCPFLIVTSVFSNIYLNNLPSKQI